MGNIDILGNRLQREISDTLQKRLPPEWKVSPKPVPRDMKPMPDFLFEMAGPKGARTRLAVEIKTHLEPKVAVTLRDLCDQYAEAYGDSVVPVVFSSFISPSTRQRLKELAISYGDPTGNVRVVASHPALYIETQGAERNPNKESRQLRSLKGPKAGRIVRALCDLPGPYGVRKLAEETDINPGYVSRVFAFLEREDLLDRGDPLNTAFGKFQAVRLRRLIERWARNYSFLNSNRVISYLDPRDAATLPARLAAAVKRVAITGSAAAATVAPVAPSRLVMAYVDFPEDAAEKLGLRPADSGANVLLAEPYDPVVFKRTTLREGVPYVALSQAAVDLLGSPGRGPSEGQALLDWMEANESAWRR